MNEPRNMNVHWKYNENWKRTEVLFFFVCFFKDGPVPWDYHDVRDIKNIWPSDKHIYFWWLSVSSSERENGAKRQRKAIKSHLFIIFCQWLYLLFCYYNEYHCLFFPRAKFGNYHAWSAPWTPQADIILSSLSGYICLSDRTETYKVEQRENQGLKIKINNKHGKWMCYCW